MKTRYGSWVMPKIAGIESSANRMSVTPSAMITMSIGETRRSPFSWYQSLRPCQLSPTRIRRRVKATIALSSGCSSSWAPYDLTSLIAV